MRAGLLLTISPRRARIASAVSGSIVKSSRAASATARSIRTGSSRRRTPGSPIVRMTRASRSGSPSTQSITETSAMS